MANGTKAKPKFGRLSSLGVSELHQIALYLPDRMLDLRRVVNDAQGVNNALAEINSTTPEGIAYVFVGHVERPPNIQYRPGGSPMAKATLSLRGDGQPIQFSLFGTEKELTELFNSIIDDGEPIAVSGIPAVFGNSIWLNKAKIHDIEYAGKLVPVYAGKARVIKPDTVRNTIHKHLDASIPLARDYLMSKLTHEEMSSIVEPEKLDLVLLSAHYPTNPATFNRALQILDKIAARASFNKLKEHSRPKKIVAQSESARIDVTRWMRHSSNLEFELTDEQYLVINEIASEMNKAIPMRGMLQGDVGTGKTVVYAMLSISCVLDANRNVIVLLPNTALALQIHKEIYDLMPDSEKGRVFLVTADNETELSPKVINNAVIRIGTTSVLFKKDDFKPGLVIVDEQQKFGAAQRNQLLDKNTHLLEVSATPIPRSVALVKFGALSVWSLKKNHTKKTIHSHLLVGREESKQLIGKVKETVSNGYQAIIVYALKEDSESELFGEMMSAEQAYSIWERMFPGRVRLAHSKMTDEEKETALNDMKDHKADVLVSTTVIEVGVTIPKAMLLATINAERFGLTTQHQLRGRLARKGGIGHYYMILPKEKNSKATLERLQAMLMTNDGYELAEMDLKLRGSGDLSKNSNVQTGSDDSILIGRKVDISYIDEFISNSQSEA